MDFSLRVDLHTGRKYMAVAQRGRPLLLNPFTNKGTAFTARERDELDLHGLLPPAICSIEQQLERTYENYLAHATPIEKYVYLTGLQDRNETLFYRLVHEHIEEMMPVVYTPTVGEACQRFSHIYRRGRGLYLSIEEPQLLEEMLGNAHCRRPTVIVVTDGERILGLGDQGAGGMGISIGKLVLYTLCAGISPYCTLPITLDVGTDNEERLRDPLYLGLRRHRVRGEEYQAFVDRFVEAVQVVYPEALLQWEDFHKGNAIAQLQRFRDRLCTFNDDIQGTAGVVLAGILSALKITGRDLVDQRLLLAGAGASAQGIAGLFVSALAECGLSVTEAREKVWMVDSRGLVSRARPKLEEFKARFARSEAELAAYRCEDRSRIALAEVVRNVRPTLLVGTSGTPGLFTEEVVRDLASFHDRPVVFPLSNPTSKSECTPEQALRWSEGRAIVATGSPFAPVEVEGRKHRIGQGNNAFVFPGVGLGVTVAQARRVTDGMFLDAAKALAEKVSAGDLREGAVYPELRRIRECSHAVACAIARRAVQEGHADEEILCRVGEHMARAMWFPQHLPYRYEP